MVATATESDHPPTVVDALPRLTQRRSGPEGVSFWPSPRAPEGSKAGKVKEKHEGRSPSSAEKVQQRLADRAADRNALGLCGLHGCDAGCAVAVTIQYRHYHPAHLFGLCDRHARQWIDLHAGSVHWMSVEPWGTWQPPLLEI